MEGARGRQNRMRDIFLGPDRKGSFQIKLEVRLDKREVRHLTMELREGAQFTEEGAERR
jgi:hypothetical protein